MKTIKILQRPVETIGTYKDRWPLHHSFMSQHTSSSLSAAIKYLYKYIRDIHTSGLEKLHTSSEDDMEIRK